MGRKPTPSVLDELFGTPAAKPKKQVPSKPVHQRTSTPVSQLDSVPVHQHTSTPVSQSDSVPASQRTSTPVHQLDSVPVHQHTSTPASQLDSVPVHQHTSTPVSQSDSMPRQQLPAPSASTLSKEKATYYLTPALLEQLQEVSFKLRKDLPREYRKAFSKSLLVEMILQAWCTDYEQYGPQSQLHRLMQAWQSD